ncbi:MAG: hypothetical protein IID16_04610 [Candidatus Marinimicrobia bacterium]|nr:hypothetical protein [Candidatus Neomarinimicrobiota bacterium]
MSTEIIALIVALLAVIVGPLVQLRISKRQINAQLAISKVQHKAQLAISEQQIGAQLAISKGQNETQLAISEKQIGAQLATSKGQINTQLITSRQQIHASVLSQNRQDWINNLRDQLSEFIAVVSTITTMSKSEEFKVKRGVDPFLQIVLLQSKISLLVNPTEEDHSKLLKLIKKAVGIATKPAEEKDSSELINTINEIISLSQNILKREWVRVKKLK